MTPPPSPRSHATGTDDTAHSHLDEEDPQDVLQRVFNSEIIGRFKRVEGQPHQSVIVEAFKFILNQTRKLDLEAPSKTDLLRHFGVRRGRRGHRLRHFIRRMLWHLLVPSSVVDHLENIESLATVYCEENTNGGAGYSFGALLDRYIYFQLIYFPQFVDACLIGGTGRRCIQGSHDTEQKHVVERGDEEQNAEVTLHWMRGGALVTPGSGPVYDRVNMGLEELLGHPLNPDFLYLCHGTAIEHASAIVRDGPNLVGAVCTDFGQAFYLTDSFEFAVFAGYMVSNGRTDTAVLVFPVPRAALRADRTLEVTGDPWRQVVRKCRTGKQISDPVLRKAYNKAECVIGPISYNAQRVDTGREEAREMRFQQWAFKDEEFARDVFGNIINHGAVHVFRILHEREDEWQAVPEGGRQGRGRFRFRRGRRR